jgi:O-antigen/teichoic acid export membrane protein
MPAEQSGVLADQAGTARDARDLRRGAWLNMLGYAARLPHPVLLAVVTQTYGASRWGMYIAGQAAAYVAIRICIMGLDRAMVYWIPRSLATTKEIPGFRAAVRRIAIAALAVTGFGACVGVPLLAMLWRLQDTSPLMIMTLGLLPLTFTEFLVNASIGRRCMVVQVMVRDAIVPLSMAGGAMVLYVMGCHNTGLAWAFVISHGIGALAAGYAFRRMFGDVRWPAATSDPLPLELSRYARPMWAAELSNCLLLRLDPMILAIFADTFTVGVYGIVLQFANTMRSLRGAFDSLVTAIVSDISVGGQQTGMARQRLRHGFSDATSLVVMTQLPVIAFLLTFGTWLLPLFGDGVEQGYPTLVLFCLFWALHGLTGLAGHVVNGIGSSRATLAASLVTLGVEMLLLWTLVPQWGSEGAAVAVGIAFVGQGLIQVMQMRWLAGTYAYTGRVGWTLLWALSCLVMLGVLAAYTTRFMAFTVFLLPFAGGAYHLWRTRPTMASPSIYKGEEEVR